MGKIYSPLAGNVVGRVGATVYRKGQNSTVAAQYQPQVTNPKTRAQSINRCAFSTATAAQSALKFIADHSFEGVRGKRANLQRFMKLNQKLIASDIKAAFEGGSDEMAGMLNIKGVPYAQPYPYVLSQGSLAPVNVEGLGENGLLLSIDGSVNLGSKITTQADYEAKLAAIGFAPGDELAVVSILSSGTAARIRTSGGLCDNFLTHAAAARVTFKAILPEGFEGTLLVESGFNPALLERSAGTMNASIVDEDKLNLSVTAQGSIVGSAAIRSALDPSGRYLYSPATLVINEDAYEAAHFVVESYEATFAGGDGSDFYLDNPARV